ncbi:MAG: hypothetical protein FIA97_08905 [Methylococcaceae bacterium]|nr:hypothetical protein [Methylococcaceae bacterium]
MIISKFGDTVNEYVKYVKPRYSACPPVVPLVLQRGRRLDRGRTDGPQINGVRRRIRRPPPTPEIAMDAPAAINHAMDPCNIMNPGKILLMP